MAQLLRKTEVGTSKHMQSAEYLAQSGDLQWFALLREVAENNANNLSYLDDAAELGGDRILPTLLSLLSSPDREFNGNNCSYGYRLHRITRCRADIARPIKKS